MNDRGFAIVLFLAAFALRFGASFVLPHGELLLSDSAEYRAIATNIVAGEGVVLGEEAKAKRPPGYPVFLSFPEVLFPGQVEAAFTAQAALSALLCVMVFRLGRETLGKRVAVWASLVCMVYPLLVYSGSSLLIEPLYSLFFLLEIHFLVRARTKGRYGWVAGLAGGLATLVQAGHVFFFFPVLLYRRGKYAGPYLLSFLFVVGMWSWRNVETLGEWVPLTTQSGYTLYESLGPDATGGTVGHLMELPPREGRGEVAYDAFLREKAMEGMTPDRFLVLALEKQRRFWSVVPNAEGMRSGKAYLATLAFLPILAGFLFALWKWRRVGESAGWLLLPILYTAAVHLVFLGSIRYRLAVEPFLVLLACWGLAQVTRAGTLSGRGAGQRRSWESSD